MNDHRQSRMRRRGLVAGVLSAAAVAVALPVSGALAGGDSAGGDPASGSTAPVQTQTTPRDDSPRDRGDCPEKDGRGGSGSDAPSGSDTSVEL